DGDATYNSRLDVNFINSKGKKVGNVLLFPSGDNEVKTHDIDMISQFKSCLKKVIKIEISPIEIIGTGKVSSDFGGYWAVEKLCVQYK
ncbi:MAG: hypothetical protein HQM12_19935, partial [SAR324 cluster bacterium]|nr:hypothetical protein [SAR324 cluster bacterium]